MQRAPRLRQLAVPLVSALFGILVGASWMSVQYQLQHSEQQQAPSASLSSTLSAPSSRRTTVPDVAPLQVLRDDDVGSSTQQQWQDVTLVADDAAVYSTEVVDENRGVGSSAPSWGRGYIPIRPLRASQAPVPNYARSAKDAVDAMTRQHQRVSSRVSKPFRFHVYDIPEKYTSGALALLEERWSTSFCNRHKVKTNYTMLDWRHAFSLFTADVFITKYLRFHPAHTDDPNDADVFVIPMMTHVYHCAGVNHYTIEIMSWLMQFHHYKLFHQHDHFMFWWRWGMHYNSVLKYWRRVVKYIPNVNIVSFDYLEIMGRNVYQDFSLALKPRYLQTQHHIVMPYPDFSPELSVAVPDSDVTAARKIFFYFAGTSTIGGIRRWIKRNCAQANDPALCYYEDFAKNVIDSARLGIPTGYPAAMKNSLFCGHAAGDALSSRRPTSAILANCIPVLICDLCLYAFENLIDYSTFAVFISEDDVMTGKLLERLKAIPQEKIESMQRNLAKVRRHFVYNTTSAPQPGDALDTFVTQLSHRGSILRQYRRWFTTNHHLSDNPRDYPVEPPAIKRYLIKGNAAEERDFNALGTP